MDTKITVEFDREHQKDRLLRHARELGHGRLSDLTIRMAPLPSHAVRELIDELKDYIQLTPYTPEVGRPGEMFEFIDGDRVEAD